MSNVNEILSGRQIIEEMSKSGVCNADDIESAIEFELRHLNSDKEKNAYLYGVLAVMSDLSKGTLASTKYEKKAASRLRELQAEGR